MTIATTPQHAPTQPAAAFDAVVRYLDDLIEEQTSAIGVQLSVALDGEVIVDHATGDALGTPMSVDVVHPGYCTTKPLLPLAIGHLLDRGLVDLDEPVQPSFLAPGATVPVVALLNHSAGLERPHALDWRLCPVPERPDLLPERPSSSRFAYSELSAGLALEELVAERAGRSAVDVIESDVLAPLGLTDSVVVSGASATRPSLAALVSVPFSGLPDRRIPLLSEANPSFLHELRPAFGSLVSAGGLCRLYAALGQVVAGRAVAGLPTPETLDRLLGSGRGLQHDDVLDRPCDFAGGFMIDLVNHAFGSNVSARSFGHAGGIAQAVGLCDPDRGLALGLYVNGSVLADVERAEAVRMTVVDLVLDGVDGSVPAP